MESLAAIPIESIMTNITMSPKRKGPANAHTHTITHTHTHTRIYIYVYTYTYIFIYSLIAVPPLLSVPSYRAPLTMTPPPANII